VGGGATLGAVRMAMTKTLSRSFAILLGAVLVLAACTQRPPEYAAIASHVPPVPAGLARLFIYRDYEPYESLSRPYLYLNGVIIGISEPGGVIYRDVPPGSYLISVFSHGIYPNQFKTVQMSAGGTYYSKITSLRSWDEGDDFMRGLSGDTFVVVLIDPEQAQREMATKWFFGGY